MHVFRIFPYNEPSKPEIETSPPYRSPQHGSAVLVADGALGRDRQVALYPLMVEISHVLKRL